FRRTATGCCWYMNHIDLALLRETLLAALREDVGSGDITSRSTIPADARAVARVIAKQTLTVAGLSVSAEVARLADPPWAFVFAASDGSAVGERALLAEIRGSARSLLTAERTILNLLQRMSGIATLPRQYVDRVQSTKARIIDTRKTVPSLRVLDKYAVT